MAALKTASTCPLFCNSRANCKNLTVDCVSVQSALNFVPYVIMENSAQRDGSCQIHVIQEPSGLCDEALILALQPRPVDLQGCVLVYL